MNEWLKKLFEQISTLWKKWTVTQKAVLAGVILAAIAGLFILFSVSAGPSMVPLLDTPITDESVRDKIILRLNEENIKTSVSATGIISVADESTARRMRSILIRE
ncbi:MAG TPA: flagellar M-ring protein FliF, partial [Treponemataceae bacterium]|nr:flagellar M-ring protein FliF [Treponemataceae bacterium]